MILEAENGDVKAEVVPDDDYVLSKKELAKCAPKLGGFKWGVEERVIVAIDRDDDRGTESSKTDAVKTMILSPCLDVDDDMSVMKLIKPRNNSGHWRRDERRRLGFRWQWPRNSKELSVIVERPM